MAIDRAALFKHLDKGAEPAPAADPSAGGGGYGAGRQLLAAIEAKDPEAVEEAIKACVSSAGEPAGDEG